MAVNKRSKNSRQRGSKTHGGGSMKKRRGAGHRGGRGAAGSGKRGDAKKPSIWRAYPAKGKHGFTSHADSGNVTITIKHLEEHTKTLLEQGIVTMQGKAYTADLTKAGYDKLLATGNATKQWTITIDQATPAAIEKIKKAGGQVNIQDAANDEANADA